jgi:hypothetical protein
MKKRQLQKINRLLHVLEIIHFQLQVVQHLEFHVLHVPEIIRSQLVAQSHVHRNVLQVHQVLKVHVPECQVHVLVLFVQVLQRVQIHHVLLVLELVVPEIINLVQRVQVHLLVHTVLAAHQLARQQLVVHNVQAAVLIAVQVAAALQVHSERMQARAASANQNQEKRCVMNSTICKRHNWVAQLFRTVMERLRSVCVAVQLWQISQKRSAQMQQRWLLRFST